MARATSGGSAISELSRGVARASEPEPELAVRPRLTPIEDAVGQRAPEHRPCHVYGRVPRVRSVSAPRASLVARPGNGVSSSCG
eukprot:6837500-Pyramimonas_sp.AAC.1